MFSMPSGLQAAHDTYGDVVINSAITPIETRIKRLAYLKHPDRIRTAILNETGKDTPLAKIERVLEPKEPVYKCEVGEPTAEDGIDFAPRSKPYRHFAVSPAARCKSKVDQADIDAIKRAAKRIPDKQEQIARANQDYNDALTSAKAEAGYLPESRQIAFDVAYEMGLEYKKIFAHSRKQPYVEARAIVYKLLRERDLKRYSYPAIARICGKRDHSTIIHSIREFETFCRRNPKVREVYLSLGGKDAPS